MPKPYLPEHQCDSTSLSADVSCSVGIVQVSISGSLDCRACVWLGRPRCGASVSGEYPWLAGSQSVWQQSSSDSLLLPCPRALSRYFMLCGPVLGGRVIGTVGGRQSTWKAAPGSVWCAGSVLGLPAPRSLLACSALCPRKPSPHSSLHPAMLPFCSCYTPHYLHFLKNCDKTHIT